MELQRVHGAGEALSAAMLYSTICAGCRARIRYWTAYADMAGEPFSAYYCQACAVQAGQHDGENRTVQGGQ